MLRRFLTRRATAGQKLYLRASVLNISSETTNALVKRSETVPEKEGKKSEQIVSTVDY